MAGKCLVVFVLLTASCCPPAIAAQAPRYADFADCAPAATAQPPEVGRVGCRRIDSAAVGAPTAFSYYVPPACDPRLARRCPVVLLLHGGGGDLRTMLGDAEHPSAYVHALSERPPVDVEKDADPNRYADPSTWVAAPAIDAVLVAPQARTLPGGFGPFAGGDGAWVDWNPDYGGGGRDEAYPTPAPRFEEHVLDEVLPLAVRWLGVSGDRRGTAVLGSSLGGYGAMVLPERHPDRFAALASISMVGDPRLVAQATRTGVDPPEPPLPGGLPYARPPGLAPRGLGPVAEQGSGIDAPFTTYLGAAAYAFGDPASDRAVFAGHAPQELASNLAAQDGGEQPVYVYRSVNDGVPRSPQDPKSAPAEQLAIAEARPLTAALDLHGVDEEFETHPGVHGQWEAFARVTLEHLYGHVEHAGGTGRAAPRPEHFSYRSTERRFSIWGWDIAVEREPRELFDLLRAGCDAITMRGTGRVTVTAPRHCHSGLGGQRTFTVDLGGTYPADDPGSADLGARGTTRTIALEPLRAPG